MMTLDEFIKDVVNTMSIQDAYDYAEYVSWHNQEEFPMFPKDPWGKADVTLLRLAIGEEEEYLNYLSNFKEDR